MTELKSDQKEYLMEKINNIISSPPPVRTEYKKNIDQAISNLAHDIEDSFTGLNEKVGELTSTKLSKVMIIGTNRLLIDESTCC